MTEQENKNTITVDDVIYAIDDMTDEQKAILNVVEINKVTAANLNQEAVQVNHQLACVLNIGEVKRRELKESLLQSSDSSDETLEEAVEEDTADET